MTNRQKVDKILECYRLIKEDSGGGMTVGGGNIAGMPPEDTDPPVDFRKKKYKKLNMFYRYFFLFKNFTFRNGLISTGLKEWP